MPTVPAFFRSRKAASVDAEQTDHQRHDAGENNPITHLTPQTCKMRP